MIKEVTDFAEVLQIVPKEVESRSRYPHEQSVPLKDYLMVLDCIMNQKPFILKKDFRIWFSYTDEGMLNGYLMALLTITKIRSLNEVRLVKGWYDHDYPGVEIELFDKAVEWARVHKIKLLKVELDWHDKLVDTMETKWAFDKSTAILSKKI